MDGRLFCSRSLQLEQGVAWVGLHIKHCSGHAPGLTDAHDSTHGEQSSPLCQFDVGSLLVGLEGPAVLPHVALMSAQSGSLAHSKVSCSFPHFCN